MDLYEASRMDARDILDIANRLNKAEELVEKGNSAIRENCQLWKRIAELESYCNRLLSDKSRLWYCSNCKTNFWATNDPKGNCANCDSVGTVRLYSDFVTSENEFLRNIVAQLESELAALKEAQRWIPVGERLPEEDDDLPRLYCSNRFTGNDYEISGCEFWCEIYDENSDLNYYDAVYFNFETGDFEIRYDNGEIAKGMKVVKWCSLPQPPESE